LASVLVSAISRPKVRSRSQGFGIVYHHWTSARGHPHIASPLYQISAASCGALDRVQFLSACITAQRQIFLPKWSSQVTYVLHHDCREKPRTFLLAARARLQLHRKPTHHITWKKTGAGLSGLSIREITVHRTNRTRRGSYNYRRTERVSARPGMK